MDPESEIRPRRGRSVWRLGRATVIVAVAAGSWLVADLAGSDPTLERAILTFDGEPAPLFELPALDGNGVVGTQSTRGTVVVLNFWASWCEPCRSEAPMLQRVWTDYRATDVQVLGVDILDDREAAIGFVAELGITYPNAFDPRASLADDYGIVGLPTTINIDRRGIIVYRIAGQLDELALRRALDGVLGT